MSQIPSQDEMLARFLEGRDTPCPGCGYNVRDLQSTRCPECGQDLELSLRLVEPKQGALIAGLIGLSAGLGLNGLLVIYALIQMFLRPSWGYMGRFFAITSAGAVACGILLVLWLVNWRRIRRLSAGTRFFLVVGCWGFTLLDLIAFSIFIK